MISFHETAQDLSNRIELAIRLDRSGRPARVQQRSESGIHRSFAKTTLRPDVASPSNKGSWVLADKPTCSRIVVSGSIIIKTITIVFATVYGTGLLLAVWVTNGTHCQVQIIACPILSRSFFAGENTGRLPSEAKSKRRVPSPSSAASGKSRRQEV